MILIGGSSISLSELPFNDVMMYEIENKSLPLDIKLRVKAKSADCIKVYLHSSLKNIELDPIVQEKVTYFNTDDDLKKELILGGRAEDEVDFDVLSKLDDDSVSDADRNALVESLVNDPSAIVDRDNTKIQLEMKNKMLSQKDAMIAEYEFKLEELATIQKEEIDTLQRSYDDTLAKTLENFNKELSTLKGEKDTLESKLAKLQLDKSSSESDLKKEFSINVQLKEQEYIDNLEKTKQEYEEKIIQLTSEYEEKLSAVEKEHNFKISEIQLQHQKAITEATTSLKSDILQLKEQLIQANKKIASNETTLDTKLKELELKYTSEIESIKSTWQNKYNVALKKVQELSQITGGTTKGINADIDKYLKTPRLIINSVFSREELTELAGRRSKIITIACSGSSFLDMMEEVENLLGVSQNTIIVDFTGDNYLRTKYKITHKASSLDLNDTSKLIKDLVVKLPSGNFLIPTSVGNDIVLLTFDWITILKRLDNIANGKNIVFLFNSTTSFTVRYLVSKFTSVGTSLVIALSNPVILTSLLGDLSLMSKRVEIIAVKYTEVVGNMLKKIAESYSTSICKARIAWRKYV